MLYVRNGSGWRRRQTWSAARPRAKRSGHSNSETPSSNVSRLPSIALCKARWMVELNVHSCRSQSEFAGRHIVMAQAGQLGVSQIKAQDVRKVAPAKPRIQSERWGFAVCDDARPSAAAPLRLDQRVLDRSQINPVPDRPECVNE